MPLVKIRFCEIERHIRPEPGLYEIHTLKGRALKVGIGINLLRRLKSHRASRDSGLRWRGGCDRTNPRDVMSKSSILAKHLYFDASITRDYDLKTEGGRRTFLVERCYLIVRAMPLHRAEALEEKAERSGRFRYTGEVRLR